MEEGTWKPRHAGVNHWVSEGVSEGENKDKSWCKGPVVDTCLNSLRNDQEADTGKKRVCSGMIS